MSSPIRDRYGLSGHPQRLPVIGFVVLGPINPSFIPQEAKVQDKSLFIVEHCTSSFEAVTVTCPSSADSLSVCGIRNIGSMILYCILHLAINASVADQPDD